MSSSKYHDYSAADFAMDESFIEWAREPNGNSNSFWGEWIKANPDKYEEIINALTMIRQVQFREFERVEEDEIKVWEGIKWSLVKSSPDSKQAINHPLSWNWMKIAASIGVVLALTLSVWHFIDNYREQQTVEVAPQVITKSNPKGRKSTFKLSDGTIVKLNADSKLSFSNSGLTRSIELEGEAYFEVSHDPERPFVVKASGIITKVLGTDFNVRAFPEDPEVKVALLKGKVVVSRYHEGERMEELILSPSEMFTYNNSSNELIKSSFNSDHILAWKDGVILFEEASFYEIKKELERWFGVDIVNKSSEKKQFKFTGKFRNENLKNILENISIAMKFRYKMEGERVIIY